MTRLLAALMFALSLAPISANADSLWRLASPSQFDDELSTIQPPASISTDRVIEMPVENLNGLAAGEVALKWNRKKQAAFIILKKPAD